MRFISFRETDSSSRRVCGVQDIDHALLKAIRDLFRGVLRR